MANIDENDSSVESNLPPDDKLTYEQISALVNNMYEKLLIMDNGNFRKLDPTKDTRAVYIDKAKLDALFAAHPGSDGLRLYFGVYDDSIVNLSQPNYNNKLMLSFVTTTKEIDNLDKPVAAPLKATLTFGGGHALGGAKLCPPNTGC